MELCSLGNSCKVRNCRLWRLLQACRPISLQVGSECAPPKPSSVPSHDSEDVIVTAAESLQRDARFGQILQEPVIELGKPFSN